MLLGSKSSKGRARPPRDTPPHGDAACGEDMGRRLDRNGKPGCVCGNCLRLQVAEGEIGPFGSIRVPVIFTPIIPGAVYTKFKVVFKNQQCPTVSTQPGRQGPCRSHSPRLDSQLVAQMAGTAARANVHVLPHPCAHTEPSLSTARSALPGFQVVKIFTR